MRILSVLVTVLIAAVAVGGTVYVVMSPVGQPAAESPAEAAAKADDLIGPQPSLTGPHPKAEVDQTQFDFGTREEGTADQHDFLITNRGEGPLKVMAREEDTTCQCTVGSVSDNGEIPPGGSVTVTLKWDMKKPIPLFRHTATIRTNDPDNRKIQLEITGKVDAAYILSPTGNWEMGTIPMDAPAKKVGYLYSPVHANLELVKFNFKNESISMEGVPMTPEELAQQRDAKSGLKITATIAPMEIDTYVREAVGIDFKVGDDPEPRSISITLVGKSASPFKIHGPGWEADANALMMKDFKADKGSTVKLFVYINGMTEDLKLEGVEQTFNSVDLKLEKDEKYTGKAGHRYFLIVTVPPGPPADRHLKNSEKINLRFNHEKAKELRMYVDYLSY